MLASYIFLVVLRRSRTLCKCMAVLLQQIPIFTSIEHPLSFFTSLIFIPPIPSNSFLVDYTFLTAEDHDTTSIFFFLNSMWLIIYNCISLLFTFMVCPLSYSSGFSCFVAGCTTVHTDRKLQDFLCLLTS